MIRKQDLKRNLNSMKSEKCLIILRGCPGSGKSTVAELLSENGKYPVCTADDFFYREVDGKTVYQWDAKLIGPAHEYCKTKVSNAMRRGIEKIFVANTNTTEHEMTPYFKMAEEFGYMVVSLVVENRHGGVNVHNVPADKLEIMKNRFSIKL